MDSVYFRHGTTMHKLFIFILPLFFFSCSDLSKKDQLNKLDKLVASLDSLDEMNVSNVIVNLEEIKDANDQLTNEISEIEDTIHIELALLIEQFKTIRGQLSIYQELTHYLDTNIRLAKLEIQHLKADIEEANGEREHYDDYIKHEQLKVDTLRGKIDALIIVKRSIIDGFNSLYKELNDELIARKNVLGTEIDN